MASANSVPYIALGDSATQGMQSLGVCWLSQHRSYPRLIADFLGAKPFTQPVLKGWIPGQTPVPADVRDTGAWFGSPPNAELLLRQALSRMSTRQRQALQYPFTAKSPSHWSELHAEYVAISEVIREVVGDYLRAVQTLHPDDFVYEAPAPNSYYQNLGMFTFTVKDVLETNYDTAYTALKKTPTGEMAGDVRRAFSWITSWHDYPSLLEAMVTGILTALEGDLMPRLIAEGVGLVLGRTRPQTALQVARVQQPQIVTLFIGPSDLDKVLGNARLYDDAGNPQFTSPDLFQNRLARLVEEILAFASEPALFLATVPDFTATPNITRSRLGHWKSIVPSADYLTDAEILTLEQTIYSYNQAISDIAAKHAGRVWLVDLYGLHERLIRETRHDSEAVRRGLGHAVRYGALDLDKAQSVLGVAQAGNADLIQALYAYPLQNPNQSWDQAQAAGNTATPGWAADQEPSQPDLNNFIVALRPVTQGDSPRIYRITGDYLGADPDVPNRIVQGGAIGLDSLHLTNTANAFIARAFIASIYQADQQAGGKVLKGLAGQHKQAQDFDRVVLEVAQEDTLLNNPPLLTEPVLDLLGALSSIFGEHHYRDSQSGT
jgi:hypothetical protein